MKIRGSHLVALAILGGLVGWMSTGKVIIGGQSNDDVPTIAEREAARTQSAFPVRTTVIQPSQRQTTLLIRGRTKADSVVSVRVETAGTVEKRLVSKGDMVKPGDVLCELEKGTRETEMARVMAQMKQAKQDFVAHEKLVKRGFATKSRLRQLKSAHDAAEAALANVKQDMKRTEVRATTNGIVQEPMSEVGDTLSPGGVCVTLVDRDPMMFTGQVSERDIAELAIGMTAKVAILGGQEITGTLVNIAAQADAQTRTFAVELELPNHDGTILDGLTAKAAVALPPKPAYQVKSNWLTLADDGQIGVRVVNDKRIVEFHSVKILSQGKEYFWVLGLKPGMRIITLGQNFVSEGEMVIPTGEDGSPVLEQSAKLGNEPSAETNL